MQEEVPIDWEVDTRDKGDHLNHTGATQVTSYLGKYLTTTRDLKDHRLDKKYENWNKSLDSYIKTIETAHNQYNKYIKEKHRDRYPSASFLHKLSISI